MTELTLTPEQQLEKEIQGTQVTLQITIADADALLNLIAELPYYKSTKFIDLIMTQLVPQGQRVRSEVTARYAEQQGEK